MEPNTGAKPASKPPEPADDGVNEASQESFPASDAPSWTPGTGEKGSASEKQSAATPVPVKPDPDTKGCATSFIMEERDELGGACDNLRPDPKKQYVPADKEKEAGGEG